MYLFDNFVYLARGPEPKIARISIFGLGFSSSEKFPSDLPSSLSLFMGKKLQVLGGFGKPWNLFLFYFLVSNSFFCTSAALETSIIRHSFGKRFKRALVAPKGCHAVYQVLELLSLVCFVYMSCAGVIVWSSCSFQGWFVLPYLVLDENSCLCVGAAFESKMDSVHTSRRPRGFSDRISNLKSGEVTIWLVFIRFLPVKVLVLSRSKTTR